MKRPKSKKKGRVPLSSRKAKKGALSSPWNALADLAPMSDVSWYHDFLPDYLWLVLAFHGASRARVLTAFRSSFDGLEKIKQEKVTHHLTHANLAELTADQFSHVVDPFLRDPLIRKSLAYLLNYTDLPDYNFWKLKLSSVDNLDADFVEAAVLKAAPQNSEVATDIAFLGFLSLVAQDKMSFAPGIFDPEDINRFVASADIAPKIGGLVRSLRNGWATHNREEWGHTRAWVDRFYEIGRSSTPCRGFNLTDEPNAEKLKERVQPIATMIESIRLECSDRLIAKFQQDGYNETSEITSSIGLYACDIAISAIYAGDISHAHGAVLIRSLAEINIILSYLLKEPSAAARYRAYGAGRAGLLAQKNQEAGSVASYLFVPELDAVANERKAVEFIDIPISSFYPKSIRDTAIEHGAKDVYDTYYDLGAMYAHAEWGGVATSSVQMCVNPLHLGHYIPSHRNFVIEMLDDVEWLIRRVASEIEVSLNP